MLRFEGDARASEITVRDVVSGQILRVVGAEWPPLAIGTVLFGRVAMLEGGLCCLPGEVTPLDAPAATFARGHAAAGAMGTSANPRWAEAVYGHVVRHGTLDVPGLNRPSSEPEAGFVDPEGGPLLALALAWEALAGGPPDEALLARTRQLTDLENVLDALMAATLPRSAKVAATSVAYERLLAVQLETVWRRERGGSGTLTLDKIARVLDDAVAAKRMPPAVRTLFAGLRQRVGADPRRVGDPVLERLVQRIQALRSKTVAQGCTEQEALAAAEKVAELLDRYGLSLGELEYRAQPCDGIGIQTNRRRMAPIDSCVPAIAAFFDCRVWLEHAKGMALRYVFFGLRGDVAAAQYLYEMVERAFETQTDAFRAGELYVAMAGERRSATNSFQIGLATGISSKLHTMRAERDASRRSASGRDLVPVKAAMIDDEMAKLGLNLEQRAVGASKRVLSDAYVAGEAAGRQFEVTPAITRAA
jgi:hypothetical protein